MTIWKNKIRPNDNPDKLKIGQMVIRKIKNLVKLSVGQMNFTKIKIRESRIWWI